MCAFCGGQDDRLKFAFMVFDEDGNGVITNEELTRILKVSTCDSRSWCTLD